MAKSRGRSKHFLKTTIETLSAPSPEASAVDALTTRAAEGEPEWITNLRHELIFKSKMTHSFTFSRDEVMQLLAAHPARALLANPET